MSTEASGRALDQLESLASDADRRAIAALRDRLRTTRLRVLVSGEAKRGKSTLVNALLGREVLPVGVTPLTAVPTTVIDGLGDSIDVEFTDGRQENFPLSALADFGTERGNPGNRRCVASITVHTQAPVLARGVEIVDMPGTGSVHAHNTAAANAGLPSMDAAIFVLTADPPVSASERELLGRVAELSVRLFVVLNKADYLDEPGLAEALAFTKNVISETTGRPEHLYPISARAALQPGGDAGLAAFAADFRSYLDTGRVGDVQVSVLRQAGRIARMMLDEVELVEHAARAPAAEAAEHVAAFGARLTSVNAHQAAAEDRVAGQGKRLLAALNEAAGDVRPQIIAAAKTRLLQLGGGGLTAAAPAEIERAGRAELVDFVVQAVSDWRESQAVELESGLRRMDEILLAELEADLVAVRAAAADLLGLQLALPTPAERLADDRRFFYVVNEQVDQAELLAGTLRRRLPGELGRKAAREHVVAQIPEIVDGHVGRARGDLQYRLNEATRRMQADIHQRYADSTERLSAALDRAAVIRGSAAEQGEEEVAGLAARRTALNEILVAAGWHKRNQVTSPQASRNFMAHSESDGQGG